MNVERAIAESFEAPETISPLVKLSRAQVLDCSMTLPDVKSWGIHDIPGIGEIEEEPGPRLQKILGSRVCMQA